MTRPHLHPIPPRPRSRSRHPRRKRRLLATGIGAAALLLAAVGSAPACSVFDSALYQNAGGAGGGTGTSWDAIVDQCPSPYPADKVVSSQDGPHSEGEVHLNDLSDDVESCGKLTGVDGPDGVVAIELAGDQVVHLEAKLVVGQGQQEPDVDLGVYIMQDCQPTSCLKRVDRCPAGHEEEFAWSVPQAGTYFFGFDSYGYDQSKLDPVVAVEITFPTCGNGTLEEGEACDDGNGTDGDGCTSLCRAELDQGTGPQVPEVEPNNYYLTANEVIASPGDTITVQGDIGGGCDLDFYLLTLQQKTIVRATLLDKNGQPCPPGSPQIALEFDDPTGATELGDGVVKAPNACASFDETTFPAMANGLEPGSYVIELKAPNKGEGMDAFDYRLRLELVDAGAGGAGGGGL